jgi:phenylpropionate dioxygenase-like ring-hydroxylating dioxygenase large terminal subunit
MSTTDEIQRATPIVEGHDVPAKAPEPALRGDPITGDRYTSREFFQREWDTMWARTWHIGVLEYQIPEQGDFATCDLGRESFIFIRQEDGSIRGFFNVCLHRGARLTFATEGFANVLTCPYHGWEWGQDGVLEKALDPHDFPKGDPCGKLKLREVACDTWNGMVWFNMDAEAGPLREFLSPVDEDIACYHMEDMVRVLNMTAKTDCNWKVIADNFNEGYHIPTLHPDLAPYIECDQTQTQYDLYENGHNRGWFPSMRPSSQYEHDTAQEPLISMMKGWDLNADDYHGKEQLKQIRVDAQRKKRELGPGRNLLHYDALADYMLTDYMIYNMFPNSSITVGPDGVQILRPRPHPTDPEKCLFDHWYLVPRVEGVKTVPSPAGGPDLVVEDALMDLSDHGERTLGTTADQDLSIATNQQQGLGSMAYEDAYLSNQERRVQRFHEVLNDYLEGRR